MLGANPHPASAGLPPGTTCIPGCDADGQGQVPGRAGRTGITQPSCHMDCLAPHHSSHIPSASYIHITDPAAPPPLTPIDNLNIIRKHFESVSTLPDDPAFNKSQDDTVKATLKSLHLPSQPVSLPFTLDQLTDACQHVNTNTALGSDDISPHFIKHGGPIC